MLTPPFIYLSSTYSNRRTENPKNRLVNLFFTNATADLAPLQYLVPFRYVNITLGER